MSHSFACRPRKLGFHESHQDVSLDAKLEPVEMQSKKDLFEFPVAILASFSCCRVPACFPLRHEVFFSKYGKMLSCSPRQWDLFERLFNLISTLLIILQSLHWSSAKKSPQTLSLQVALWCCLASTYPLPLCYVKRKYKHFKSRKYDSTFKTEISNKWGILNQKTTICEHVWQSNKYQNPLAESSHVQWN